MTQNRSCWIAVDLGRDVKVFELKAHLLYVPRWVAFVVIISWISRCASVCNVHYHVLCSSLPMNAELKSHLLRREGPENGIGDSKSARSGTSKVGCKLTDRGRGEHAANRAASKTVRLTALPHFVHLKKRAILPRNLSLSQYIK